LHLYNINKSKRKSCAINLSAVNLSSGCMRRSYSVSADSLLTGYVLQILSPKQKLNADTDDYGSGVGFWSNLLPICCQPANILLTGLLQCDCYAYIFCCFSIVYFRYDRLLNIYCHVMTVNNTWFLLHFCFHIVWAVYANRKQLWMQWIGICYKVMIGCCHTTDMLLVFWTFWFYIKASYHWIKYQRITVIFITDSIIYINLSILVKIFLFSLQLH